MDGSPVNDVSGAPGHKKKKGKRSRADEDLKPLKKRRKLNENGVAPSNNTSQTKKSDTSHDHDSVVAEVTDDKSEKQKIKKSDNRPLEDSLVLTALRPHALKPAVLKPKNIDSEMGQRISYEDVRSEQAIEFPKKMSKREALNIDETKYDKPIEDNVAGETGSTESKKRKKKKKTADAPQDDTIATAIPEVGEPPSLDTPVVEKTRKKKRQKETGESATLDAEYRIEDREESILPVEQPPQKHTHRKKGTSYGFEAESIPLQVEGAGSMDNRKSNNKKRHRRDSDQQPVPERSHDRIGAAVKDRDVGNSKPKHKKRKHNHKDESGHQYEPQNQDSINDTATSTPKRKKTKSEHKHLPKAAGILDAEAIGQFSITVPTPDQSQKRKNKVKSKEKTKSPAKAGQDREILRLKRLPGRLRRLLDPSPSPFRVARMSILLPIIPIGLLQPMETIIAKNLAPLIGTFYRPLGGLILSFHNPILHSSPPESLKSSYISQRRLGEIRATDMNRSDLDEEEKLELAKSKKGVLTNCVEEDDAPKSWLSATFLLFKPEKGMRLMAYVNVQTESFLGLLLYNFFTVGIDAKRLGPDFKWMPAGSKSGSDKRTAKLKDPDGDDEMADEGDNNSDEESSLTGHWLYTPTDRSSGTRSQNPVILRPGHALTFTILNYDTSGAQTFAGAGTSHSFMSIEGTLLTPEQEKPLVADEKERWEKRYGAQVHCDETTDWASLNLKIGASGDDDTNKHALMASGSGGDEDGEGDAKDAAGEEDDGNEMIQQIVKQATQDSGKEKRGGKKKRSNS